MKVMSRIDMSNRAPYIQLSELFNGVAIHTDAGEFFVCQRDGGIEIRCGEGPWYRWVDPAGPELLFKQTLPEEPAE